MKKQGGFFIFIILALAGAGFFCTPKALAAEAILISEVQITGGPGKTGNDFIELYNPNNVAVNLKGYRLVKRTKSGTTDTNIKSWTADAFIAANGYYLWASSGCTDTAVIPNATTTMMLSDDNGIAIRFGAADSGVIIDSLAWGGAQNAFIESAVFPTNPGANQSLARQENSDTNNNSADFFMQNNPTPQSSTYEAPIPPAGEPSGQESTASTTAENIAPLNPPPRQAEGEAGSLSGETKNNLGDVVVNEFLADPFDEEVEWLELYNRTGKTIDLSGWQLEDGSGAKTSLSGSLEKYKVIEKPNGNLNNAGDLITLYDATGKIIDQAAYGNWADGDLSDNAPAAADPASTARKFDGYLSFNNFNDFAVTLKPTKGAANIIEIEDEVSLEAKAKFDFSNDIFITEILPNPDGDDTKLEFIEIHNAGARPVNLSGWSLANEDGKKKNLENLATSTLIGAGEYLALYRPKSKLVLHNDSGEVRLYQPLADKPAWLVKYQEVKEGWGYNKVNADWVWSEIVTPGAANLIKAENHAPEVGFSFKSPVLVGAPVKFDSSDTADADGDELKYAWDFGDGLKNNLADPEHVYFKTGIYKIKLTVSDGKETVEQEKSVRVVDGLSDMVDVREIASLPGVLASANLVINEIYPDPEGADTGAEWLELVNEGEEEINLSGWQVKNSNGKFKFEQNVPVAPGEFYVLKNSAHKLAFKNSADVINLFDASGSLADSAGYAEAAENESYAKGENGNWFWTSQPTPGAENVIKVATEASIKYKVSSIKGNAIYIETDLEKVREMEIGSLVKLKGTVAVEPGLLGAQFFYIIGSPGLQIYNYKKDFPNLKLGDYIEAAGELALAQGELRLKTKEKADIKITEHKTPPAALAVSCDQASEEMIGQLIQISGEITDKKSTTLYLDDGNDEILIYIKQNTGISTKNLTAGQKVTVSGILSKTASGLRLLPRYQSDIAVAEAALEPQVLGEVAASAEWELAARDKKMELFKYLLIIAGGVIIILGGLFVKIQRKSA